MGKRKFRISFEGTVTLELDDAVIDVVDDEWRSVLYKLYTPEQIAEHIAYNLLKERRLGILDGWADQPDENAAIWDEDWELEAKEIGGEK